MSNNNARIFEKDIMTALIDTEGGSSEIVDLNGASKFSCQAIYDVSAPGPKTFDSGVASHLIVQDLTYTAATRGVAGDSITIQYVGDGVAGAETVNVTATAIVVHMDPTVIVGSTATQIKAAIDASAAALLLVSVAISGTGSNVQAVAAATPLAGGVNSEVDVTANTLAIPSHGFSTGLKVRLTTTGTLPAGLATGTDYFVIVVDDNTIKLASSLSNAEAGTPVDITGQGSSGAVNTVTATALAGASVKFQKSNDRSNWIDIQAATTITVDGNVLLEQPEVSYRWFKAVKGLTSGIFNLKCQTLVIGDPI